jgi:ribose 5-phosphate isomerase B
VKLAIAADHGGLALKNQLVELLKKADHAVEDLGTHTSASCDYPDFAHAVAKLVTEGKVDRGILVCGSGVGMSIAANRHAGVRAVVCTETYSARMSREHNDANVLCLGERVVGPGLAWDIVQIWLATQPEANERHARRREKIESTPT